MMIPEPEGVRHRNWGVDNSNQNNNRSQEQRQNQNRMYNNRAINALALDSRNNRETIRCNHCSRTNHTDNECYYRPVNMQSNARNGQDGQFRNQGNQNNWIPRRNENVRLVYNFCVWIYHLVSHQNIDLFPREQILGIHFVDDPVGNPCLLIWRSYMFFSIVLSVTRR